MTVLLCDYGEVLSRPQPAEAVAAMSAAAGIGTELFRHRYWQHRAAYDRGDLTGDAYWQLVAGRDLSALDVASWLHLDDDAVAAATACGVPMAILSNAPPDVADAVDRLPALAAFTPRLFSCRLGVVKPDPAIYRLALDALGTDDVAFVDDRPANVEAAVASGIRAVHYVGPGSWAEVRRAVG